MASPLARVVQHSTLNTYVEDQKSNQGVEE